MVDIIGIEGERKNGKSSVALSTVKPRGENPDLWFSHSIQLPWIRIHLAGANLIQVKNK
jgi:hypothetical protein